MPSVNNLDEIDRNEYPFQTVIVDSPEGLITQSPYQYAVKFKDRQALIVSGGKCHGKDAFDRDLESKLRAVKTLHDLEPLLGEDYCFLKTENAEELRKEFGL